ncbi:hypothetical protein F5146DRAFT_1133975 [Armillaria mellea]|nr:hypothetical protein F5146DRAFT_1133975 [Armillaria mellea]
MSVVDIAQNTTVHTRGYQQEMLDESLKRNIIIAMDTGSGKTHIAVLRLKIEVEREPRKISWFLVPTVALSEQQCRVIRAALPVSVGPDIGVLRTESVERRILTPLRHSYIQMGRDIGLMIFDEAHHTVDKAPYNMIMKEFYFGLLPRDTPNLDPRYARPMILGLTASPIYGGDVAKAFSKIEGNLDSVIRTPRRNREELEKHVHRPVFKHVRYDSPDDPPFSTNLESLRQVVATLNIDNDPYIISLRRDLERASPRSREHYRLDQKLSQAILKENTFTHKGLHDFERTALDILFDLGAWAADWYVFTVLEQAKKACQGVEMMPSWQTREKKYMLSLLNKVCVCPVSYYAYDIVEDSSQKVAELVKALLKEKEEFEAHNEAFSGLVFVTRRDAVLALTEILTCHPETKDKFKIGSLLGTSDNNHRHSFLDLTRKLLKQPQEETLSDFQDWREESDHLDKEFILPNCPLTDYAAFKAYKALYDNELLDDHLLPLFFRDEEIKKLESEVEKRVGIVSVSPQINPWAPVDDSHRGLCPPSWFETNGPPTLFTPHGDIKVALRSIRQVNLEDEEVTRAREYTRRLFWSMHGQKIMDGRIVSGRIVGKWLREENEREGRSDKFAFDANAQDLGDVFWYPPDLTIVRAGFRFGKVYRFIAWRYDTVNEEELEDMKTRYFRQDDLEDIIVPAHPRRGFTI